MRALLLMWVVACAGAESPPAVPSPWHPVYLRWGGPFPYACAADVRDGAPGCFLRVEGATYAQGAQATAPSARGYDEDARPDEGPVHDVTVGAFWLQRFEVDAASYGRCLDAGACRREDVDAALVMSSFTRATPDSLPANGVSWEGARRYCAWLGARLPTEAEWELAARGTDGRRWPWGNEPGCGPQRTDLGAGEGAIAAPAPGTLRCIHRQPSHAADHGPPAASGAVLMAGSVWEWVGDVYGPYASGPQVDPRGPAEGPTRVQRGGGWTNEDPTDLRTTARGHLPPDQRLDDVGFRCAVSDEGRLMLPPGAP